MMISEPTPVMSSTKQIDNWSTSRFMFTWKPATGIQEYRCTSWLRWLSPSRLKNAITPYTNDATGIRTPSRCPQRSVLRPPSSSTTAPNSGNASSSQDSLSAPVAATVCNVVIPSVLQQVRVVHRRGPAGPEDRHQDREADDDLGGGHHHHDERDDLPVQVPVHPRERDEGQVAGVQHQLDAHEHDDGVAPDKHAHPADHEQDHRQGHVVNRAHESALPEMASRSPLCSSLAAVTCTVSSGGTKRGSSLGSRGDKVGLTESSEVLPSGSKAGRSAASCSAYTPGDGSGARLPLATRRAARSRCEGFGE